MRESDDIKARIQLLESSRRKANDDIARVKRQIQEVTISNQSRGQSEELND